MAWDAKTRSRHVAMPEPGFFLLRLRRKGMPIACRIFRHEGMWRASIGPILHDPHEDWTQAPGVSKVWLGGEMIDESTYRSWLDRAAAVAQHDPDNPIANPMMPLDLRQMKPLF